VEEGNPASDRDCWCGRTSQHAPSSACPSCSRTLAVCLILSFKSAVISCLGIAGCYWVCRLRCLVKGPGYLHVPFGFEARTLTGMAGLTTNPYALLCHKFQHICKLLSSIPSLQFQYTEYPSGTKYSLHFPNTLGIRRSLPYGIVKAETALMPTTTRRKSLPNNQTTWGKVGN